MRIYKEKNRGVTAKSWTIAISDQYGKRRKFGGFRDKETTRELGRKLERLVTYRKAGRDFDSDLERWLEQIPPKLQQRLVNYNLLDGNKIAAAKPLMIYEKVLRRRSKKQAIKVTGGYLFEYKRHLQSRECTENHIRRTMSNISAFIESRKLKFISSITTNDIEAFVMSKREYGSSARTVNSVIAAIKSFCNWLMRDGYLKDNPARLVKKLNEKSDNRRKRRAMTENEVEKLLQATLEGEIHHEVTGQERHLIYRLALTTGLRHNEILTLSTSDFQLQGDTPSVTVRAENEKAGRGGVLPLQKSLAKDLLNLLTAG